MARRDFLTRMGAALALAGLGGCTRAPSEEIIPYVTQPPEVRPGTPRYYATASVLDGYATGIVVESHTGRPTKVEGNPAHPASLGAAGAFEQASILSLYDPARARSAKRGDAVVDWNELAGALVGGAWVKEEGRGLHLHLEPTSSPTAVALIDRIRSRYPRAAVTWEPTSTANAWKGARIAFGRVVEPRYALDRAEVILVLDADLLASGPASLRHARHFADGRARGLSSPTGPMNRLYVVEPLVTVTGINADHRLRVRAEDVGAVAAAIAQAVGLPALPGGVPSALYARAEAERRWIDAVARDLARHRGRSVVVAGDAQPPHVHALVHAINVALGNVGATVTYAPSPVAEAGTPPTSLADALGSNVDTLVVCAENPVYAAPRSAELIRAIAKARQSAYLGEYADETAAACTFTVGRAHALESWGDARAFDGTLSIIQPLVEPLFGGRTELEILALLAGTPVPRAYDLVRERFRLDSERSGSVGDAIDRAWRSALRRGIVEGTAFPEAVIAIDWNGMAGALARAAGAVAPAAVIHPGELEVVSRLDPRMHDGRFANNAWLLELPSPTTKLTWSNAATFSRDTAAKLGIETGDELEIRPSDGSAVRLTAHACVVPGQADDTLGLTVGWGRTRGAPLAHGRGTNARLLGGRGGVLVRKTGERRKLPITQQERDLHGRDHDVLRHGTLDEVRAAASKNGEPKKRLTLYENRPNAERQWGMAIDLTRCIGCEACVVACQAENNVPTVGADEVILSREMHWLRVDSYVVGDAKDPTYAVQPMLCQHCEKAPCEYVCPVNATVHSPDGLNEMVYNRCVGTRFCSNNCPYKVRRFNWFDFHHGEGATEQLVHNPDVTVRQRGVMEKCTFCVQRIREWEIKHQQGRPAPLPRSACQQTCPTGAIVFGDLRAPGSEVQRLHDDPRAFGVLDEALGTEPRVRYLARVRNPNPELA